METGIGGWNAYVGLVSTTNEDTNLTRDVFVDKKY